MIARQAGRDVYRLVGDVPTLGRSRRDYAARSRANTTADDLTGIGVDEIGSVAWLEIARRKPVCPSNRYRRLGGR